MIAALFLALSIPAAPAPAAGSWCDSLYTVALATSEARAAGMPRQQVELAAKQLPTPEAQHAGEQIVTLAYTYNADGGLKPRQFARLVRQACTQSETP
jgi:hypothetical protein